SCRTSHNNYARKRGKYTSSKRKKVQERASLQKFLIGLNNTTNSIKQLICWQRVKWDPVKLYPNIIFDKNDNPDCSPTPEEVASACKIVNDKFFLLYKGRSVVRDPQDKNSIIAMNPSLALTCDKEQKGYYNNPLQYFGDHFFYMFCSLAKGVLLPAVLSFHYFIFLVF
ncbi:hypothetical protein MJO29_002507, partial [Puccinia striiformis f. sp. tritici]